MTDTKIPQDVSSKYVLTFEQVESCFPENWTTDEDSGLVAVSVQELHDFARAIEFSALRDQRQRTEGFGEHSANVVPDGWRKVCQEIIDFHHQSRVNWEAMRKLEAMLSTAPAGHSGANATTHEVTPSSDAKPETGADKSACEGASLEENNGEAVYCVPTEHVSNGMETYEHHSKPVPNADYVVLFTHPSTSSQAPDVSKRLHDKLQKLEQSEASMRKAAKNLLNAIEYGQGPTLDEVHQEYKSSAVDEAVEQLRQALANGEVTKSEDARLLALLTERGFKYEVQGEDENAHYVVYADHGTVNDPERTIYGRGYPLIEALRKALWTVEVGSEEHP